MLDGLRSTTEFMARSATSGARVLPDFLIIGAQKAGTTSLSEYLEQLDAVRPAFRKEVHYFDHHHTRGEAWYRAHFPRAGESRDWLAGDASPFYLAHPKAPERAAALLPDARIVALLRDPVERAFSHFHHERALGHEDVETFREAVDREEERTAAAWEALAAGAQRRVVAERCSYVRRGLYAPQLRRWLASYPREQVFVGLSSDMFADPAGFLTEVTGFLGLGGASLAGLDLAPRNARQYKGIPEEDVAYVRPMFEQDAAELAQLLGREIPWA
ncbi:sulfotransferase domain-containing protein [Demequina gelatinilytica]|uniref:sulfotransferase domain-containing protein n=1 Tax=Demequina gelatinilytica TaxID=1638980 RepID=UPI000782AD61|nr:sulfotransferase domain-containing protein [Demequina gelatinilytica]